MDQKLKVFFFKLSIIIFSLYVFILITLYFFQRNLLYHPSENNYYGDNLKVSVNTVKIKTKDNLELIGWYHKKNNENFKTILFLHGNAGSLENRIHKINHFKDMNINFLIIAWRGFSGNNGKPTEKGLYIDGKSAIDWLIKKGVNEKNLILYGESLGTGVAVELGQDNTFNSIILESPFTSIARVSKIYYPYLPVNLLLKDRYDSIDKINKITKPVLIMHGMKDNIVPQEMGIELFQKANQPKYSYFPKDDDHMMNFDKVMMTKLKSFIYQN